MTTAYRSPDAPSEFLTDVLTGLSSDPKTIPCKYLYDARGSAIFEIIATLRAYYPTRVELEILRANADEIVSSWKPATLLIELGSGASAKTCALLDRTDHVGAYVPVDISMESLKAASSRLRARYPSLRIDPVCADYTRSAFLPEPIRSFEPAHIVIFFPGSTLGNFTPWEARAFLGRMREMLGPSGEMILGVDTKKSWRLLHQAYNDSEGVTAAFNLNLLRRINTELGGTFSLRDFRHEAPYVTEAGRVEMRLCSRRRHDVRVGPIEAHFEAGESILTECSYKYAPSELASLAEAAGFAIRRTWTDPEAMFSVTHWVPDV